MSNLSGLPPASVVRAAAVAVIQDVAVRLINLPDTLQNNPQPVKLTGKVLGQNSDGSVKLETDKGVITLMMKDRGNLPVGQSIEIEIPSGRPPQQALLRPAPQPVPTTQMPPAVATGATTPTLAASLSSSSLKLDRFQNVKSDDIAEALASAMPEEIIAASAPLQAGQILRLTPLPQMATSGNSQLTFSPEEMFTALMNMIEQATDIPVETKQTLLRILSTIDISTLLPENNETAQPNSQPPLAAAFQKLVQALDLPGTLKLQNTPLQNTPSALFNSARPIDVRILAFQSGTFETVLAQTGNPAPVLVAGNFVTVPQTALPPIPLPEVPIEATSIPVITVPGQPPVAAQTPIQTQTHAQIQTSIPVTQPPTPAQPAQPPAMLGVVTGFTQSGQPVVSLAVPGSPAPQNYAVQFIASNVTEGSPVIVMPLPVKPGAIPSIVPFAIGQNISLADWAQPDIWDSLQTLMGAVSHINPALGQTLTQMIPNSAQPQNMGALSLFFLSVMRSGDLDTWLSQPTINLLRTNGKIDLLRQLAGESSVSNRLESAALPNEWRAAMLPFLHDQQVHKLPLFYKQWKDENEEGDRVRKENRMRFLFNLKLSRMGDVQVDGFMQKEKLDMILRTKSIISTNMQQALKKTYTKAMERSNLSGEISFQFKPEQWVHIDMPIEVLP